MSPRGAQTVLNKTGTGPNSERRGSWLEPGRLAGSWPNWLEFRILVLEIFGTQSRKSGKTQIYRICTGGGDTKAEV